MISSLPYETSITEYRATFAALSLVCRMFRDECQPRVFHCLHFRGHPQTTHSEIFWNWLSKMDERRSAFLLAYARDCTFYAWSHDMLIDRALTKIPRCANLTSITLLRYNITASTLGALLGITALRSTVFKACRIQPADANSPVYTSVPKWTSISVAVIDDGKYPWFFSSLHRLIDMECLEHFSTNHAILASNLFFNRIAPRLHTFVYTGWLGSPFDLSATLQAMPNLAKLHISGVYPPPPPASHIVSRLASLAAHPPVAACLLPHRPVSNLEILHQDAAWLPDLTATWLQDIQGCTMGLREVSIPGCGLSSIRPIDFPVMETITIRPRCGKKIQTFHFPVCMCSNLPSSSIS